jgi:pyridoxamine 5'-phosphate oxidase
MSPTLFADIRSVVAPANDKINSQADQYKKGVLDLAQLDEDPFAQFHKWFTHAQQNGVHQPETVCLSTASLPSGRVSARMVYLKELDKSGFVIYSNFGTSKKAADLESNKWASLTFWWREFERQVRVEGLTERLTPAESQVYFDTRIRGSRIGAWASRQSQVLKGREELEGWVGKLICPFPLRGLGAVKVLISGQRTLRRSSKDKRRCRCRSFGED